MNSRTFRSPFRRKLNSLQPRSQRFKKKFPGCERERERILLHYFIKLTSKENDTKLQRSFVKLSCVA
jgi:hypothetical protein